MNASKRIDLEALTEYKNVLELLPGVHDKVSKIVSEHTSDSVPDLVAKAASTTAGASAPNGGESDVAAVEAIGDDAEVVAVSAPAVADASSTAVPTSGAGPAAAASSSAAPTTASESTAVTTCKKLLAWMPNIAEDRDKFIRYMTMRGKACCVIHRLLIVT